MKYEIDIPELPKGWKAVAFRKPIAGENYIEASGNMGIGLATCSAQPRLIVEKIQPLRIVLEETNEERRICFGEWYESQEGKLMHWPYGGKTDGKHKVWREVKETNEEPKLSLSVDECKEAMRKLETFNVTDLSVKICRFLKDK